MTVNYTHAAMKNKASPERVFDGKAKQPVASPEAPGEQ
jgi:hypothetical protein